MKITLTDDDKWTLYLVLAYGLCAFMGAVFGR